MLPSFPDAAAYCKNRENIIKHVHHYRYRYCAENLKSSIKPAIKIYDKSSSKSPLTAVSSIHSTLEIETTKGFLT
jgi:hypothetical protein